MELNAATSTGGLSQQQIKRDDNIQHTMGWERITSAWPVNETENTSIEWRTLGDLPCYVGFATS